MTVEESAHVENIQRSLGRRIRDLRTKRGWTQEQFAEFCGLHRTYMGHVERGEKNVSLSTVLRVANALGIRISALFGRSQGATSVASSGKQTLHRLDVNRLLDELQDQRQAMKQMVRELSRSVRRLGDPA
jgi:transcriptional regulator with XRE-family HTH domain